MPYPVEPYYQRHPRVVAYAVSAIAAVLIVGGLFWLVAISQAKARDAERLADMYEIAGIMLELKLQHNSFRPAASVNGCTEIGVPINQCDFSTVREELMTLRGPRGDYYTVTAVPNDDSYGVGFTLERSYSGLARGAHTLTPQGIQ